MKILKIIDGHVTNSSSASCPVVLAVRKGMNVTDLLIEYGIPRDLAQGLFYIDDQALEDYELDVDDLREEYDFYYDGITISDWGEGDLWKEQYPEYESYSEAVEQTGEHLFIRDDELTEMMNIMFGEEGRECLVRDDLILIYVGPP